MSGFKIFSEVEPQSVRPKFRFDRLLDRPDGKKYEAAGIWESSHIGISIGCYDSCRTYRKILAWLEAGPTKFCTVLVRVRVWILRTL